MKKKITFVTLLCTYFFSYTQVVTTFAGDYQVPGFNIGKGVGIQANFNNPYGMCIDANGNIYIADSENNRIRKIDLNGFVSTIAGSTLGYEDGTGTVAKFNKPSGICIDNNGNLLVADTYNHRIRKISPSGVVTTIAGSTSGNLDGIGINAKFDYPSAMCIDSNGNIYVAQSVIRKISPSGIVSTLREKNSLSPIYTNQKGICINSKGEIYFTLNHQIKKVTVDGVVVHIAGTTSGYSDGSGTTAMFDNPYGIALDKFDNLYVTDLSNHKIRKITPNGEVTTVAGNLQYGSYDGQGTNASFYYPYAILTSNNGDFYISQVGNGRIRKMSASGFVTTYAGYKNGFADGNKLIARFSNITGFCKDNSNNLYVVDNQNIRKITPDGEVSDFVGANNNISGFIDGIGNNALFDNPQQICRDSKGNFYVTDKGNLKIRKITPDGIVSTFAGSTLGDLNGPGNIARFSNELNGICIDALDNLYVVDAGNYKIKKITPGGVVSTYAGSTFGSEDGPAGTAKFWQPHSICIDTKKNLYVSETFNKKIRKITPEGIVSTFSGSTEGYQDGIGTEAKFYVPQAMCIDANDNLYVNDISYENYLIRKITPAGIVSTFAGSTRGYSDGSPLNAKFSLLSGIGIDNSNNLYVYDFGNYLIRKIENSLGTKDFTSGSSFNIYPNPARETLNINTNNNIFNTTVTIYNLIGEVVLNDNISEEKNTINISKLTKGIYIVVLINDNIISKQKIIIE